MRATEKRRSRHRMANAPSYRSLDTEPSYQHPLDEIVHARVDRASKARNLARAAQAVVDALGKKRRLWFGYEAAQGRVQSRREAAYFDLGVEHGTAACAAHGLWRPSKTVRALADRVVRELLATGVGREEIVRATIVAAWALLAGRPSLSRPPLR